MNRVWLFGWVGILALDSTACRSSPAQEPSSAARSTILLARSLPRMEGNQLRVTLVEVTYEPGAGSRRHTHPCPVVGYVLEGALRFQVEGEPEVTYHAGQSFYEPADAVHQVSANASRTEPVRFLAGFTCDREAPLSAPLSEPQPGGDQQ